MDSIEIHAHTGYLLDQFMTWLWNRRGDAYGGDLEGRLRLPLEIIEEVRRRLGRDFPLIFRYSADHMIKGGRKIEGSKEIAKRFEEARVDALHIDASCYEAMPWIFPPEYYEQGCLVHLAEEIKRVVDIPIITVGRISDPEFAEKILEEGKADFIAMGRQLLADPEWPKKVREGRIEDIRRCIACNEGCIDRLFAIKPISCTLNPEVGREAQYRITPALKRKKVLVIGGGPAGMEAARVAALRGHDVTLCEKTDKLGGLLIPAAMPEFKKDLNHIIKYYSTQLRKLNVKVEFNKEVTLEKVNEMKPDVVIVATGSTPFIPKIPGINKRIVVKAIDVLISKVKVKDKVVIAGGGLVGCETALFLANRGKKVTIVEMLPEIAPDVNPVSRIALLKLLREKGVKWMTNMKLEEITDEGAIVLDLKEGVRKMVKADNIVLALGMKSENRLFKDLKGKVPEVYAIGDCVKPRKIINAIHEGSFIARQI